MPVRNGAKRLERAVESCLAQTLTDFELILVDDHSTDETPEIIKRFKKADSRIRALECRSPAGGLVPALNTALEASQGEFVARMDSDDRSYPERFAAQVSFLRENQAVAVSSCQVRILSEAPYGAGEPAGGFKKYETWLNGLLEPGQIARERFIESPVAHPSVMMRRGALEGVGGYAARGWAEDYDLWLRMMEEGMLFAKIGKVLMDWHDRPDRHSRTSPDFSQEAFMKAKAHYLGRLRRVRREGVVIAGAGPTGKKMAGLLGLEGAKVHAFLDVHPRRIGLEIQGVRVFSEEGFRAPEGTHPVYLAAVGQPGRREAIRKIFGERGMKEGEDFFCIA